MHRANLALTWFCSRDAFGTNRTPSKIFKMIQPGWLQIFFTDRVASSDAIGLDSHSMAPSHAMTEGKFIAWSDTMTKGNI